MQSLKMAVSPTVTTDVSIIRLLLSGGALRLGIPIPDCQALPISHVKLKSVSVFPDTARPTP